MAADLMVDFLQDLQSGNPELTEVIAVILRVYHMTSIPDPGIDFHYLQEHRPGDYYSPLPSREEFERVAPRIYDRPVNLAGVNLREKEQLRLYARLAKWYESMPFKKKRQAGLRYFFDNDSFCHADAFWLYSMMLELKPRRIVEVGSGFSSCVMLDTNERFLNDEVRLTFIEPYPERLFSLLWPGEKERVAIHEKSVQNMPLEVFAELEAGDFLFIDSSHVGKIGSDLLYLLHVVLPLLKPGVIIHFHDIFYPFEYPRQWVAEGRAWNECYFIHTFLQYNTTFAIKLFGHYLGMEYPAMLARTTPLCLKNTGGSLWLEKLA